MKTSSENPNADQEGVGTQEPKTDSGAFTGFGAFSVIIVLALLYFGLLLPDWHSVEDIRAMVVPFVLFGLFSGILLSAIEWTRPAPPSHTRIVFLVAVLIALLATELHILQIEKVGFRPKHLEGAKHIPQWFYLVFAYVAAFFFGCCAVCGLHTSIAFRDSVFKRLKFGSLDLKEHDKLLVAAVTAAIGLLGSVLTAILGGKGL